MTRKLLWQLSSKEHLARRSELIKNITNSDLKIINDILNSPKNIFYSALQNKNEVTESTEVYQEKYNKILNKIENFFLQALTVQQKFDKSDDDDDDDDNEHA